MIGKGFAQSRANQWHNMRLMVEGRLLGKKPVPSGCDVRLARVGENLVRLVALIVAHNTHPDLVGRTFNAQDNRVAFGVRKRLIGRQRKILHGCCRAGAFVRCFGCHVR